MYFSSQILFSFFWHSSSAYQNIFNLLLLSVFQQFEILARSGRALWCFTGRFPSVTQSHQPTQSVLKGPHHLVRFHSPFLHRQCQTLQSLAVLLVIMCLKLTNIVTISRKKIRFVWDQSLQVPLGSLYPFLNVLQFFCKGNTE